MAWHGVAQESGAASNYRTPVGSTPAAMRETSHRELMVCLQSLGRIGFPPIVSADAALGFSRMADQGAVIAMTMCDARKLALAR